MSTPDMSRVLLALVNSVRAMPPSTSAPNVSNQDLAHLILNSSHSEWTQGSKPYVPGVGGKKKGPSVIGRIFDVLSRPNYAVASAVSEGLKHGSIFEPGAAEDITHGAVSGIAGTKKTTFSKVLDQMGVKNDVAKGVGGFALDVLADPTTYIGPGLLKGAVKGITGGAVSKALNVAKTEAPKAVPELSIVKEGRAGVRGKVLSPEQQINPAHTLVDQVVDNSQIGARLTEPKKATWTTASDPAEISLAQKVANEYARKLKTPDKTISPRQQTLMYNAFLRKTGKDKERAAALMEAAEQHLETTGIKFKLWEGSSGKFTDMLREVGGPSKLSPKVLREFETGKITTPHMIQASETMRSRSAMADAPRVKALFDDIIKLHAQADATMSQPMAKMAKTAVDTDVKKAAKEMLISPASVKVVEKFLDDVDKAGEGAIQLALDRNIKILRQVATGDTRKFADVTEAVNKAKATTMRADLKQLGEQVKGNRTFDSIATSLSTWFKNPDLRPIGMANTLSAPAAAQRRFHVLRDMFKGYSDAEKQAAWRAAQGGPEVDNELGTGIRSMIEDMASSSGVVDEAASSLTRSMATLKDINRELAYIEKRYPGMDGLRFTNKQAVDPATGTIRDYTGGKWLKSWELWNTSNPENVIHGLQHANEILMKKYAMVDDIVARWGSRIPQEGYKQIRDSTHGLWRMRGYYLPDEIADQLPYMFKQLDSMYERGSDLGRLIDQGLGMWKRGVTIYVPSHHIRNLTGDMFIAWLDGVTNPKWYNMSRKLLSWQSHRYAGAHINELIGKGAVEKATGQGKVLLHTKSGVPITDEMIYSSAMHNGLLLSSREIEDIMGDELKRWQPFKGKVHDAASHVAELREHYAVLAHYAYAIAKSSKKDLKGIYEEAAGRVRKYHPNGTDITGFERTRMRRLFPFYSWTRKAIPLLIESMVYNPRKILSLSKGMEAAQTSMGIETPGREDPFPVDQAFPDWMKEAGIGPLGLSGRAGLLGLLGGLGRQAASPTKPGENMDAYTLFGQNLNPFYQLAGQFTPNPVQGAEQMLNPVLQGIVEIGSGKKVLSGAPVGQDIPRYVAEKTPLAPLYRILNRPGASTGKTTGAPINVEALLNSLFAAGVMGTGPFIPNVRRR